MKTIMMMAMTANGHIAKDAEHPANWTSAADKQLFAEVTKAAGVIIMGLSTFKTIGRLLPGRLIVVLAFEQEFGENVPGRLEFRNDSITEILADLEKRGYSQAVIGGGATVNRLFLEEDLIDELFLTIEPKMFGDGLMLFYPTDRDFDLELLETRRLSGSDSVFLHYKVKR